MIDLFRPIDLSTIGLPAFI